VTVQGKAKQLSALKPHNNPMEGKNKKARMHKNQKFYGKSVWTNALAHFVDDKNTFKQGALASETIVICCTSLLHK